MVISQRAKLDLKMNYLVVRKQDETVKIFLGEIGQIIIESTAVSLTASLLCELVKRKIKVIFCDEKGIHVLNYCRIMEVMIQVRK